MSKITRRNFLKSTAAASALLAFPRFSQSAQSAPVNEIPATSSTQSIGEGYRLGDAWQDLLFTVSSGIEPYLDRFHGRGKVGGFRVSGYPYNTWLFFSREGVTAHLFFDSPLESNLRSLRSLRMVWPARRIHTLTSREISFDTRHQGKGLYSEWTALNDYERGIFRGGLTRFGRTELFEGEGQGSAAVEFMTRGGWVRKIYGERSHFFDVGPAYHNLKNDPKSEQVLWEIDYDYVGHLIVEKSGVKDFAKSLGEQFS